jgi:glycosyltransferase involved in cell wall biosynthesis
MGRICVIRQGDFPLDPRVRREVDALVGAGHEVDVIALRRPGEELVSRRGPVRVYRIPLRRRRGRKARYLLEYAAFFAAAGTLVSALHLGRRYDVVQVHSLPDPLVFAALVPRLFGARVLLDLHECMPEFFASKFEVPLDSRTIKLIARLEQASIRFASWTITCTEQMREAFVSRGADAEKITVVVNSADEETFDPDRYPPKARRGDQFVLISHGSVEERYGLDTAIHAVAFLKDEIPGLRLEIYGEGSFLPELRELAHRLGVSDRVSFSGAYVPMPELLRAIASADAGLVAMKRDAFRDLTQCNKMYDLMAMRRPAIVSRTRSVEEYFGDRCFQMFTADDPHDLARAVVALYADAELGDQLVERATAALEPYRWHRQRAVYLGVAERLLSKGSRISSIAKVFRRAAG